MNYGHFPSEVARNKLKFPAHKQQLLEFVIEVGVLFGVIVGAYGNELVPKCNYIKFQNQKFVAMGHCD